MQLPITIIKTFGKDEYEVTRKVGEQIEQAWANGTMMVQFDNTTLATSAIKSIEHTEKPDRVYAPGEIADSNRKLIADNRSEATVDSPGYRKFQEAKERLKRKMSLGVKSEPNDRPVKEPEVMPCKWVKNIYQGDRAKKTIELADKCVGYIILERPSSNSVTVAFRVPSNSYRDFEELDELEAEKMDLLLKSRSGITV